MTQVAVALAGLSASLLAFAQAEPTEPVRWQLNMTPGVTQTAANAYSAHMMMLWICVVIGVVVFGAMAYALLKFRKSKGAVPDTSLTHSTKLELIWTVIPVLILLVSAWPATEKVIAQYGADHNAEKDEMVVKITGYQWMWRYEYVGEGVDFISRLDRKSDDLRQDKASAQTDIHGHDTYLRDVDKPLVIPADTRIRFVITADDVIHSWWVPALGWKQDAIPGIINDAWTKVDKPGTYRGVCAELCGKDHGFMPIVVKVLPKPEYAAWLAAQKPAATAPAEATPAAEAAPADAAAAPATAEAVTAPAAAPAV
ncbi:MAG: cytochrome c oxidase subunit II [Arenimonas sp.]